MVNFFEWPRSSSVTSKPNGTSPARDETAPPSYNTTIAGSSPLGPVHDEYLAATQTTTTHVTTTTTTHFFPLFRRKGAISESAGVVGPRVSTYLPPSDAPARTSRLISGPAPISSFHVDKDLPLLPADTPSSSQIDHEPQPDLLRPTFSFTPSTPISSSPARETSEIPSNGSQPTLRRKPSTVAMALAHASLGLGSPPVGVTFSPALLSPDETPRRISSSLTFADQPSEFDASRLNVGQASTSQKPPRPPPSPSKFSTLRRLKSFSRLSPAATPVLSTEGVSRSSVSTETRRKRGLSIGPSFSIFSMNSSGNDRQENTHVSGGGGVTRASLEPALLAPSASQPLQLESPRPRVHSDIHLDKGLVARDQATASAALGIARRNSFWSRAGTPSNSRSATPQITPTPSALPLLPAPSSTSRFRKPRRPKTAPADQSPGDMPPPGLTQTLEHPHLPFQPEISPFSMAEFGMNPSSSTPTASPRHPNWDPVTRSESPDKVTELDDGFAQASFPMLQRGNSWASSRSGSLNARYTRTSSLDTPPLTSGNHQIYGNLGTSVSSLGPPSPSSSSTPQSITLINSSSSSLRASHSVPLVESPIDAQGGSLRPVETPVTRRLQPRRSTSFPKLASLVSARRRSRSLFLDTEGSSRLRQQQSFTTNTSTTYNTAPTTPDSTPSSPASPYPTTPTFTRPQGNQPPLLRRLSVSIFSSSTPPSAMSRSSTPGNNLLSPNTANPAPPTRSGAFEGTSSSRPSLSKKPSAIKAPAERETPEIYLARLTDTVSKAEVASVLATSNDAFHTQTLQLYMSRFDFQWDPLDVALRKLLMDVGLPRETQQIDRVMEAFASRYEECNPGLFTSTDHPYILAFSLIMLHTDAFNKSNKNKMTKADYIKNTRLPGIPLDVLDCFFDNITFAPFIFIEDPMDINGQKGYTPDGPTVYAGGVIGGTISSGSPGSGILGKQRVDPYFIIAQNLLGPLRADVASYVPASDPYSYPPIEGLAERDLHRAFAYAEEIEIMQPVRRKSMALLGGAQTQHQGRRSLKITQVGILARKEDLIDGKKKATRKWKEWSVILTGSQLLFFKETSVAISFLQATEDAPVRTLTLKPDEIISLNDTIAVYDDAYAKYDHVFRFVMPNGHEYLMKASNGEELDQWVSRINYASAFKTSGVRMRAMGMTGRQAISTGTAAAVSHVHDLARQADRQYVQPFPATGSDFGDDADDLSVADSCPSPIEPASLKGRMQRMTVHTIVGGIDLDHPASSLSDARLEDTFKEVKAELAGLPGVVIPDSINRSGAIRAVSLGTSPSDPPRLVSSPELMESRSNLSAADEDGQETPDRPDHRSAVVREKIRLLDLRATTVRLALDADLRIARNIAVLTPFQRSTRERVRAAVFPVAKRVRQLRLDLHKLQCHRDTLAADLAAEEDAWQRTKTVAMKAAAKELRVRNNKRGNPVPRMRISEVDNNELLPARSAEKRSSERPESSTGSFYSATDDHTDVHTSSEGLDGLPPSRSAPQFRATLSPSDFPLVEVNRADITPPPGFPFPAEPLGPSTSSHTSVESPSATLASTLTPTPSSTVGSPELPEDEQAEDWDKTRCAKRVSLVTVSKEVEKYSVRLGRQALSEILHPVGETDPLDIDTHYRSKSDGP